MPPAAAAAAAAAATAATATPPTPSSLGQSYAAEVRVLEALMYRNRNQHGRTGYWKRLQHVRRLLRELALPELFGAVQGAQQELLAIRGSSKPRSRSGKAEAAARARLRVTGRALQVAAGQCARVLRACLDCADALAVEVAQGFFLNLALLLLALLGRIHALVRHAGVTAMYVGQALLAQQQHAQPPEEAGVEPARVSAALPSGRLARALGVQAEAMGGNGTRASGAQVATTTKDQGGAGAAAAEGAGDDEDDLGVALGPALARVALPDAPAPWRGLTTRVIPTAKGKVGAQGQGRALLATDWSSSEEEEEAPVAVAPALVTSQAAEHNVDDEEEEDGEPLFVLDREPEPPASVAAKPGKEKKEKERGPKPPAKAAAMPAPSFLSQLQPPPRAPAPALSLPSIGRKRKPKPKKQSAGEEASKNNKAGSGSPLDVIDMIFGAAAPQGKKRRKG